MKLRHFLFFCLLGVFFSNCKSPSASKDDPSNNSTVDTTSIRQLFPLAYGDYWTNDIKQYDTNGFITKEQTQTQELIATTKRHGALGYVLDDGSSFQQGYFYSDSDVFAFEASDTIFNSFGLFLRYPMTPGVPITLEDGIMFNDIYSHTELLFVGKGEEVTVPAGTFSCYHFENITIVTSPDFTDSTKMVYYLCPGVGLVRETSWTKNSGTMKLENDQQLLSYRVH